jgi:hypothetical protein
MGKLSLVDRDVGVSNFNNGVTCLAVVNRVQYCLVSLLYPIVGHEII